MAEKITNPEAYEKAFPPSEIVWDSNLDAIAVGEMGYSRSTQLPEIASEDNEDATQKLQMLIEAGNHTFAVSDGKTRSGKYYRALALVGRHEGERAQLVHFFDTDKPVANIAIGRQFDGRDLFNDDPFLSREHFSVTWGQGRIRVDDLASTHGTGVGVARREDTPKADNIVSTHGIKRVVARAKAAASNKKQPSESARWSLPTDQLLEELGEK